jgi:hypothetical protein
MLPRQAGARFIKLCSQLRSRKTVDSDIEWLRDNLEYTTWGLFDCSPKNHTRRTAGSLRGISDKRNVRCKTAELRILKPLKEYRSDVGRPEQLFQLSALQTELSNGDQVFLESIQKDRAPRVRNLVQRLMGAIAGQGAENPALAACMERILKSKTGLLKKRASLKLELPAMVKEHETNRWVQDQFADVSLDEFARAYGLTNSELVEATEKDENLLFALALMAAREGRFALVRPLPTNCRTHGAA